MALSTSAYRLSAFFLFFGLCFPGIQHVSGQDQKVADSLALIYQADTVKGVQKMELLRQLSFNEMNDRELLLQYAEELIDLAKAEKNDNYLVSGYTRQGYYHLFNGDLDKALESFFKSAEVAVDARYIIGEANAYTTIADVYSTMGNFENAELYYDKSIQLSRTMNDSVALASALLNAGDFYFLNDKYDRALQYFEEGGSIFIKLNHKTGIAYYLGNSAMIYAMQGADSLALDRFNEAIPMLEETEDYYPVSVYLAHMSDIYLRQQDVSRALDYALESLDLAREYNLREQISDANLQLSKVYEQAGVPDKALNYYKDYIIYRDSLKNIESVQQMADLRTDYEVSQKQIEVDLLDQKRQNQRIIIIATAVTLVLLFLLAMGLYYRYLFIKRTNVKIKSQRDEIESQREEVEAQRDQLEIQRDMVVKQNNEILDSITYAQRIQTAMLPPEQYFHEILNDGFILFKPRDIVSGDFFWIKQVNQVVILAAADCTGHGVPGAFMSLLGISYLNEIVQRREITQASQVLNELRKQIRNSLRQHGQAEESRDGIDMALCVIDEKNNALQYSGANIPLYLIRGKNGAPELTEFKADRMPLGYYPGRFETFTKVDIQLEDGDVFYLFSDGFIDQKGGRDNKKFMSKRFKELLLKIHQEPMHEQKNILDKTITDWMGDHSQIDDILVIGIRV